MENITFGSEWRIDDYREAIEHSRRKERRTQFNCEGAFLAGAYENDNGECWWRYNECKYAIAQVWQAFEESFSPKQQADMNTVGYTLLDMPQYKILYAKDSPYYNEEVNVTQLGALSEMQKAHEMELVSLFDTSDQFYRRPSVRPPLGRRCEGGE